MSRGVTDTAQESAHFRRRHFFVTHRGVQNTVYSRQQTCAGKQTETPSYKRQKERNMLTNVEQTYLQEICAQMHELRLFY